MTHYSVKIITDTCPFVKKGNLYTVEKIHPNGFIKLFGISNLIPENAVEWAFPEKNNTINYFVQKRQKIIEEYVIISNVPSSTKLDYVQTVKSNVVDIKIINEEYVDNVSVYVMNNQ